MRAGVELTRLKCKLLFLIKSILLFSLVNLTPGFMVQGWDTLPRENDVMWPGKDSVLLIYSFLITFCFLLIF